MDDGLIWPLEYGDGGATPETAKFVLNGSLVGYISLKALSDVIKDEELEEYLHTVEKTYAEMFPRFHKGETWTYYMLHPLTVIPVHYMIFEEKLLQAAWHLSGKTTFRQEYEYRSNCLKSIMGIDFTEEDGVYSYYMLRACSPNYYQIDTYATQIEFCNEKGEVISTRSITGSGSMNGKNRQFINSCAATGSLINLPYSYNVYSGERDDMYLLFSDKVRLSVGESQENTYSFTGVARDAVVYEQNQIKLISIDKDQDPKAEGDIVYKLDGPLNLNTGIFLIEINNLSDQNVPIGLLLYDSKGNGYNRYYMPLLPGANAVVFDEQGFVGAEDLKDISSVWLRIYDEDIDTSNLLVYPGNLKVFGDHISYISYIDKTGYTINPQ